MNTRRRVHRLALSLTMVTVWLLAPCFAQQAPSLDDLQKQVDQRKADAAARKRRREEEAEAQRAAQQAAEAAATLREQQQQAATRAATLQDFAQSLLGKWVYEGGRGQLTLRWWMTITPGNNPTVLNAELFHAEFNDRMTRTATFKGVISYPDGGFINSSGRKHAGFETRRVDHQCILGGQMEDDCGAFPAPNVRFWLSSSNTANVTFSYRDNSEGYELTR